MKRVSKAWFDNECTRGDLVFWGVIVLAVECWLVGVFDLIHRASSRGVQRELPCVEPVKGGAR